MNTVNISLTSKQVKLADNLTEAFGFANRSEFFRAILRLVAQKPKVLRDSDELILEPPDTKSVTKIVTGMRDTGEYNEKFLKSIEKGLRRSKYFSD